MTDLPSEPESSGMPDLGALLGGGGGGLGDLLAGATEAMAATQALADQQVEGSAGGGMVRILATGGGEVLRVTIDPAVVDPADVEGLQDLVLAALRDVNVRVAELHASAMGGFDPSSMLGGLLGGGDAEEE